NGFEATSMLLWAELARNAEYIADIGANTGVYSLAAGAINPAARVVALEPVPRIYDKLRTNVALNTFQINAIRIAASHADGDAVMFDTYEDHNYSASLEN